MLLVCVVSVCVFCYANGHVTCNVVIFTPATASGIFNLCMVFDNVQRYIAVRSVIFPSAPSSCVTGVLYIVLAVLNSDVPPSL